MLRVQRDIPESVFGCNARDLAEVLGGPTLFELPGRLAPALFVSVLLHGNEDTGWLAVRDVLAEFKNPNSPTGIDPLPRALMLFVGNVEAAHRGVRQLEGQPDYNRIWAAGDSPEHNMARTLIQRLQRGPLFAGIDIHNNTGRNPHYACINHLDAQFISLAQEFSSTVVYFRKPDTVISLALSRMAPAIALECGRPGEPGGVEHAREFLRRCLTWAELPVGQARPDVRLFHTTAIVRVPPDVHFAFNETAQDIQFIPNLDDFNFQELPRHTMIARLRSERGRLAAEDENGTDVSARYFERKNGSLVMRTPAMLSMLTLEDRIIRQDCLCYLMERLSLTEGSSGTAMGTT